MKNKLLAITLIMLCFMCISAHAEKLIIPSSVIHIDSEAFMNDSSITEVVLPEGIQTIGDNAFSGSGLESINLPSSISKISSSAFEDCPKVKATVTEGSYSHRYCENMGIQYTFKKVIKVGIINNDPAESGYREANVKDFENEFTAENGYEAKTFYSIRNDEQLSAAKEFIADGVDYLLICAAESAGWDEVLTAARDNGIGVFLFDRIIDCDESLYIAAVAPDCRRESEIAVAWLEGLGLEEYNIIHIQGMLGSDAQINRSKPLEEKCEADDKWNIIDQRAAAWYDVEAQHFMESVIKSGKQFNIVFAENESMARGAEIALDEYGISHGVGWDVIIIAFDGNKWALRKVLAGSWNFDVQCSPFQAKPISDMIKKLESGQSISGLGEKKRYPLKEIGFDARTITEEDIEKYGIGE